RNEIEIASHLARDLGDPEFIVPLRLKAYKPHLRIAHLQYVNFSNGWAAGLAELLELLTNVYEVPRIGGSRIEDWRASQAHGATNLVHQNEVLTSNWLTFRSVPTALFYCEPPTGFPLEKFQERGLHR